jgi:hypothetical protein
MLYVLKLSAGGLMGSKEIGRASTTEQLIADFIKPCYAEHIIEEDADHPNHFDIFAHGHGSADVFTIEPVKGN